MVATTVWEAKQEQKGIFRAACAFFCLIRAYSEPPVADEIRILPEKSLRIFHAAERKKTLATSKVGGTRLAEPKHAWVAIALAVGKRG